MAGFFSNDYFKLFVKREGRVVLGRNYSNLWIITAVLSVAFMALSFSNASTKYLRFTMEDPFIRWQNIDNPRSDGTITSLSNTLQDPEYQEAFHYTEVREDYKESIRFYGKDSWGIFPRYCRYYTEMDTPLMRTILSPDLVINKPAYDLENLENAVIGIVVTDQMLSVLGYSHDNIPAYLYLQRWCDLDRYFGPGSLEFDTEEMDSTGFYTKIPVPVLGVVERLPGNIPFASSSVLFGNTASDANAFNLGDYDNWSIANSLLFYVDRSIDIKKFEEELSALWNNISEEAPEFSSPSLPYLQPFRPGVFVQIDNAPEIEPSDIRTIVDEIKKRYSDSGHVVRVFDYQIDLDLKPVIKPDFLTVEFMDLKKMPEFVNFVSEETQGEIELDSTQTKVKENLNAVQLLADVLSTALIFFAIVCIVLFIVNLLQSYFQRVKRNLGTFKAFGIGNKELIGIYLVIIVSTVFVSVLISLLLVWIISIIANAIFSARPLFDLWCSQTLWSILIVIAAAVATVYIVMGKLLKATPGDLIYDRQ